MASWKKVIVSGSDAVLNQLNVGTTQVITSTSELTTTKLTGSFTGSFFGDGTGITGITATGLNIPGQVTQTTSQPFVVSGSAALQKIDLSDVLSQITGSGLTKPSGTATTIMLDTASAHFTSGVSKEVFDAANFVDSTYIDFTVTAGTSVTAVISSGSIQNGHLANSAVTVGAVPISLGATAPNLYGLGYVYANNISGSFITASNGLYSIGTIVAGNPAGAPGTPGTVAGEFGFFGTVQTTGLATLDSATVTTNLTVGGDLTVNGTASFINSTNLYVKDQFVLLNSGSSTLADSGIVAAYSASGVGSAFYLEATPGSYGRWGIAYNVSGTATTVTADAYMVAASQSAGVPPATPTWGGATYGYGNIHVNSSNGDIYIYS